MKIITFLNKIRKIGVSVCFPCVNHYYFNNASAFLAENKKDGPLYLNFFYFVWSRQDSPDQGALHLVRGLLNVVQDYSWELNGGSKMSVYLNAVSLLSAMSQVCFFSCYQAGD